MTATYQSGYTGAQMDEAFRKSNDRCVGSLYVTGNETATTIALTQTYYRAITPDAITLENGEFTTTAGRLTYTSATTRKFMVILTTCLSLPSSNVQIRCRIGKNGTALQQSCAQFSMTGTPGSGLREAVALHTVVALAQNDYLDLMVGNWTDTNSITVRNMQFTAYEI